MGIIAWDWITLGAFCLKTFRYLLNGNKDHTWSFLGNGNLLSTGCASLIWWETREIRYFLSQIQSGLCLGPKGQAIKNLCKWDKLCILWVNFWSVASQSFSIKISVKLAPFKEKLGFHYIWAISKVTVIVTPFSDSLHLKRNVEVAEIHCSCSWLLFQGFWHFPGCRVGPWRPFGIVFMLCSASWLLSWANFANLILK